MKVEEQETQRLPFPTHTTPVKTVPVNSATSVTSGTLFQQYLDAYHLTWFQVARTAQVPCMTVWSIAHSLLVTRTHAGKVRSGLLRLTGIPYAGPIPTI